MSLDFDWDSANLGHIRAHGAAPEEIEEAVARRHEIIEDKQRNGENRWKLFGKTATGRYLVVVFTVRLNRFQTITAYTLKEAIRKGLIEAR